MRALCSTADDRITQAQASTRERAITRARYYSSALLRERTIADESHLTQAQAPIRVRAILVERLLTNAFNAATRVRAVFVVRLLVS